MTKKLELTILAITLVFMAFTAGFFIGRSSVSSNIIIETQHGGTVSLNEDNKNSDTSDTDESFTPGFININTADEDELTELPGIGEVIAQRIIDYREENGDFQSIEEIKNVSGIGDSVFADIRSMITVGSNGDT